MPLARVAWLALFRVRGNVSSGDNNDSQRKDPDSRFPKFNLNNRAALVTLLVLIVIFLFIFVYNQGSYTQEVAYSVFLNYLNQDMVAAVDIIDAHEIQGQLKGRPDEVFKTTIPYSDPNLLRRLEEGTVQVTGRPRNVSPLRVFIEFLPWVLGFFFIWFMFRQVQGGGNRAFSFGKSRAKRFDESSKKISFTDVAGQDEAKYELLEVVEFLKDPGKFVKMGARIPKGVLLVGRPGTGKTLLAKAIAGEANVPFFHMSGSDFVEMFVGVGASRVRDLFEQGRKNAPCILFIDELDAVGRTRGAGYGGGHDEREQTLNQMLVEMDGFDTKEGVIIIAATNRPDVLDAALLRAGRFDRQVVVDMPDVRGREEILGIHIRKIPTAAGVDLNRVARATPGTSGADLANIVNEAALLAARRNKERVDMDDFEEARDKIMMGVARHSMVLEPKERKMTAFHESGHALLHYHLEHADPLHKVTIVPHGGALGVAFSLPEKDYYSHGRSWLLDRIAIIMGGYAAERIIYRETSTGAQNDIEQATDLARKMVCEWGMSDALGPVAYGKKEEPIFLGKEIARHKDYSEETARVIDAEVNEIVSSRLARASELLTEHQDQLTLLATTLVKQETLNDVEIRRLLGMGPRQSSSGDTTQQAS